MANGKKIINFQTKDGVKIIGDFFEFADFLFANSYNVLNIDERGHGESEAWPGEMGSWQEFTQSDYDKTIYDVEAALQWLSNRIPDTELTVIGGSIGANLAFLS